MHRPPTSAPAPVRVLFVLSSFDGGGAERSLLELIRRLDRSCVQAMICVVHSNGTLRSAYVALEVPIIELGAGPGLAQLRAATLLRALVRFRPHVVHGRMLLPNLWARLGALTGAKVVCEERGLALERPALFDLLNQVTLGLCHVVVANSQAVAEQVRVRDRVAVPKLRVIVGGVDVQRFRPDPHPAASPEFDLITVARLETYKGIYDLVAAMGLVTAQRPGTRLLVVGGGSQQAKVQEALRRENLAGAVELAGWRGRTEEDLRRGRLFVLASHEEGLPNAVLEAMACGLPVVATGVGGTVEVVSPGETGALVAPRAPELLADAILSYLDHPERMAAHGAAGRHRVIEHFDFSRTVFEYQRLYLELASR